MDTRLWIRVAAVVCAAAAIAAAALDMAGKEDGTAARVLRSTTETSSDPLRAAQRRCQLLGEAAVRDRDCLAVWAETRDRFLGTNPAPTSPQLHHWR